MINPIHITKLVRNTLTDMGVYSPSMEMLIKGTFLVESDLTNLYEANRHGLMMMRDDVIIKICKEYIKYKPILKEGIHAATGVDVGTEDTTIIIAELESNIRLMVAVLYSYYNNKNEDIPDDNLEKVALFYRKHYDLDKKSITEEFVDYYKEVFIK